mgnify:CR=1 FL=1
MTVPSCVSCNKRFQLDEDAFVAWINFGPAGISKGGKEVWKKLNRAYRGKDKGLKKLMAKALSPTKVFDAGGKLLKDGFTVELDGKRIARVIEKIVQENEEKVTQRLKELNFDISKYRNVDILSAEQVYNALIEKAKFNDQAIFKHFREPNLRMAAGCQTLINATKELVGDLNGFYLKKEKAAELLRLNPPKNIMAVLGYGTDVEKMLASEDIFEIFCALRFAEDEHWLNDIFFKPYKDLKPDDFEEREIRVMVLPERWLGIGKEFLGAKLHHMSHLKELGIVFIIPTANHGAGEILYLFFMTLHYIYEVDWHSRLFKIYSREPDFAQKMISALRVEVGGLPLPDERKIAWRIVAKYLAKHNPNDPRLFEPHISPEAWHYTKTSRAIHRFSQRFPELGLDFWSGLDEVGECFPSDSEGETLISFDLYDCGIALLKQSSFESKYLYHQQEALWNKIFVEYMGEEAINKLMMENLDKGYVIL